MHMHDAEPCRSLAIIFLPDRSGMGSNVVHCYGQGRTSSPEAICCTIASLRISPRNCMLTEAASV